MFVNIENLRVDTPGEINVNLGSGLERGDTQAPASLKTKMEERPNDKFLENFYNKSSSILTNLPSVLRKIVSMRRPPGDSDAGSVVDRVKELVEQQRELREKQELEQEQIAGVKELVERGKPGVSDTSLSKQMDIILPTDVPKLVTRPDVQLDTNPDTATPHHINETSVLNANMTDIPRKNLCNNSFATDKLAESIFQKTNNSEILSSPTEQTDNEQDNNETKTNQIGNQTEMMSDQTKHTKNITKDMEKGKSNNNLSFKAELMTEQVDYNVVNVDTIDDIIDRADNDKDIKMNDIDTDNNPGAMWPIKDIQRPYKKQDATAAAAVAAASCCSSTQTAEVLLLLTKVLPAARRATMLQVGVEFDQEVNVDGGAEDEAGVGAGANEVVE